MMKTRISLAVVVFINNVNNEEREMRIAELYYLSSFLYYN